MTVYNGERYLSQAIDSLVKQDFPQEKYFILVIDDGSTDSTPLILNSYEIVENFTFMRNKKNKGVVFSINKALLLVKCKFILRFDADDIASPDLLSELYRNISGYAFCHPYMYVFYGDNIHEGFVYKVSALPSFFACSVLFRHNVVAKHKYADLFWEEFDMYIRILEEKKKYKILPKVLYYHRIHPKNVTKNKDKFVAGYSQLQKKWKKRVLKKYDFTLENLFKFYGYYFSKDRLKTTKKFI